MNRTPINRELFQEKLKKYQVTDFAKATIREIKGIAEELECESGVEFVKMEMGVPGLPPAQIGVEAEIEALQSGIASLYPDINGDRKSVV